MNKIKALYDIAKAMRMDSKHEGTMSLSIMENEDVILTVNGELSQGDAPDEVIHEIKVKGQFADKKIDHQSRTVSNINHCHRGKMRRHMMHVKGDCHQAANSHFQVEGKCDDDNLKGRKLDKLMFGLDLLNRLEMKEDDGKKVLSLKLSESDMPEHFSQMMKQKMAHKMMDQCHASVDNFHSDEFRAKMIKFHEMKMEDISLTVTINENNRPERIQGNFWGSAKEDKINVVFELNRK